MHLSQQVLSASETYLSQTGPLNKINRLIKLNNPIHIITIKATNPNSSPSIQRNATQYKVRSDESKATKPLPHPLLFSKPHPPKTPNAPKEKAIALLRFELVVFSFRDSWEEKPHATQEVPSPIKRGRTADPPGHAPKGASLESGLEPSSGLADGP
jgi:hypothetical protein